MERSDAWFIAVVAAAMGFIAGLAWSDTGYQATWLATYQTLIAGFMAVAAAYITVNAMGRSDEQQRIRHAEQMEFAREPHRLVKRRVSHTYPAFFGNLADIAQEIGAFVAESNRAPEDVDRGMINLVARFLQFLRIAMDDESLRQARQFFEPDTESYFYFVTVKQREFAEQEVKAFLEEIVTVAPLLDEQEAQRFFRLCDVIHDMERPLSSLSAEMVRLA